MTAGLAGNASLSRLFGRFGLSGLSQDAMPVVLASTQADFSALPWGTGTNRISTRCFKADAIRLSMARECPSYSASSRRQMAEAVVPTSLARVPVGSVPPEGAASQAFAPHCRSPAPPPALARAPVAPHNTGGRESARHPRWLGVFVWPWSLLSIPVCLRNALEQTFSYLRICFKLQDTRIHPGTDGELAQYRRLAGSRIGLSREV